MKDNKYSHDSHPELPLDPDVVQPGAYKWPPHLAPTLQLAVFIGGCFGTLVRYGISVKLPVQTGGWPTATFIVNLAGAFMLGFLLEALARRGEDKGNRRLIRLGIGTGFIGSFTTYSALAVETDLLARNARVSAAILYAFITLIAGLILNAVGIQLAAAHHKKQRPGKS